jgi:hypothetical protein
VQDRHVLHAGTAEHLRTGPVLTVDRVADSGRYHHDARSPGATGQLHESIYDVAADLAAPDDNECALGRANAGFGFGIGDERERLPREMARRIARAQRTSAQQCDDKECLLQHHFLTVATRPFVSNLVNCRAS